MGSIVNKNELQKAKSSFFQLNKIWRSLQRETTQLQHLVQNVVGSPRETEPNMLPHVMSKKEIQNLLALKINNEALYPEHRSETHHHDNKQRKWRWVGQTRIAS